jgi:ABC-2 type transport system ATP-binding protein
MAFNSSAAGVLAATSGHHGGPGIIILIVIVAGVAFAIRRRRRRDQSQSSGGTGPSSDKSEDGPRNSSNASSARRGQTTSGEPEAKVVHTPTSVTSRPRLHDGPMAIELDGLTKAYGSRNAVDDLSFTVAPGTVCGFLGPNGAGKTTTIRMLLGLITPTGGGQASVLGHSITEPSAYLKRVGAMIEGPAFYSTLSGRQNLEVLATLGGFGAERIDAVLDQVDLGDRAADLYKSYSLGMKQRLGIAAALLPDPDLLVLDEPTNGLDPTGIREVRNLLRSLADDGTTVFVSSHLLEELQQICDDVVIIRTGRLLFAGPVDELIATQQAELVAVPEESEDLGRLAKVCDVAGYPASPSDGRLHIQAPVMWAGAFNRAAMAEGITLVELRPEQQSLEDIFFELTEAAK